MGKRRILYQDTCDPRQVWTTDHCDDQAMPRLVVQNLTFAERQLHRQPLRGRRGRGGLRPRRPAQDREHDVRRQPLRPDRPRPRGRRRPRALAVPRPAGLRRRQHLPRRPLQQRLRTQQHRRLVDRAQQPLRRQPRDRASAPTRSRPGTPGGGSGGAIYTDGNDYRLVRGRHPDAPQPRPRGRRGDLLRQQRPHRHPPPPLVDPDATTSASGFETRPGIFYLGHGPIDVQHSVIR